MDIEKNIFGFLSNGKKIKLWTLKAGDLKLCLTNIGAAWTSLIVPSKKGDDDILLGFSGLNGYLNNIPYLGVTVGRFANRIKNAAFNLNGETYHLEANNGGNCLHSGSRAFAVQCWKSEAYEENEGVYIRFELESADGDCGFPGKMTAVVSYGLTKSNELICDYHAAVSKPCPVNLTNHAYFNLAGEGKGDILSHEVTLYSSSYVDVDSSAIPTGKIIPVEGTDFDFRKRKKINASQNDQKQFSGFDHCFVTDGKPGEMRPCAEVYEPVSGRTMKVFTTQPGVQFYTGNFLNITGKYGGHYAKHSGFCLETQHYPDSPNHDHFPSCIAAPLNDYHERAVFTFDF